MVSNINLHPPYTVAAGEAAMALIRRVDSDPATALDIGHCCSLEHINLVVSDREVAECFYIGVLGRAVGGAG